MRRLSTPGAASAAAFLAAAPTWVWAQAPSDADTYGYGHHMMWGFGMVLGPLLFIFVLALVIAIAALLVRWLGGPVHGAPSHQPPSRTPLDILKERFARGESTKRNLKSAAACLAINTKEHKAIWVRPFIFVSSGYEVGFAPRRDPLLAPSGRAAGASQTSAPDPVLPFDAKAHDNNAAKLHWLKLDCHCYMFTKRVLQP